MYKLFYQISNQVHDASGIENPEDYFWEELDDVWYPVLEPVDLPVYQKSVIEIKSNIEFKNAKHMMDLLQNDPSLNNVDHGIREPLYETEKTLSTDIENGDGEAIFSNSRNTCTIVDFNHKEICEETIEYLKGSEEYRDTSLSEHLYSTDTITGDSDDDWDDVPDIVKSDLEMMEKEMERYDAAYARIIF